MMVFDRPSLTSAMRVFLSTWNMPARAVALVGLGKFGMAAASTVSTPRIGP